MTWAVVAKKDFRDAARSKVLWALSVLFVLFAAGAAYVYTILPRSQQGGDALSTLQLLQFLQGPVTLFVPLAGLLLGYKALAGEVESGSVKLLLSLPHRRLDVVLGKIVGRTAVLGVSLVIGFLVAIGVVVVLYPNFSPVNYLLFVLMTLVYGLAYVSIGVGISAATKSATRAAVAVISVFILFYVGWEALQIGVYYLLNGRLFPPPTQRPPDWYLLFDRLNPDGAFGGSVTTLLSSENPVRTLYPPGELPFYLTGGFAFVILLAWVVIPAVLGYLRFDRTDL